MFKITAQPTFTHPVTARVPVDGGHREETFKATYRVLGTDEIARFNLNDPVGVQNFLQAAILGVDELVDENERPVPYSDAVRDQLVRLPYVRIALARAYFEAVAGAKLGN